jgi:hypothetical protein
MIIGLVYVGAPAPKYFWKNLSYISKIFPKYQVTFITDQKSDFNKAKRKNIDCWLSSDVSQSWSTIRKNKSYSLGFRNEFWFLTVARFVAIAQFMNAHTNNSLLQVEGDVWLSPDFPLSLIESLDENFAFPLESPAVGVASTLYIRNHVAANLLLKFAETFLTSTPEGTDMQILGEFALERPNDCLILPSAPPQDNDSAELSRKIDSRFHRNTKIFNGIFDGVQWGAYMLGEDPRNRRGVRCVFNSSISREVRPWEYRKTLGLTGLPEVMANSKSYPIFSLHIHAKNPRLFNKERIARTWRRRMAQEAAGLRREIVFQVLLIQGTKALMRRFKRVLKLPSW